ncbi:MAG TPA: hypothetical protein VGC41_07300 [Kofleriaceae bacterium]
MRADALAVVLATFSVWGCDDVFGIDHVDPPGCRNGSADEDLDGVIDGCDPCPADPEDLPVDTDRDQVDDVCDPNPDTFGDSIVLFDGFTTDLHYQTTTQSWGHSDDGTYKQGLAVESRSIVAIDAASNVTLDVLFSQLGDKPGTGGGVSLTLGPGNGTEVDCMMVRPDGLEVIVAGAAGTRVPFAVKTSARVRLHELTDGSFSCDATTPEGEAATATGPAGPMPEVTAIGFRSASAPIVMTSVTVFDTSGSR